MAKTAIVILNFNGLKFLTEFLPTVVAYSSDAEVYVVDNASSDNSSAYVREHFKTIKIIQFEQNHGFTRGYNLALQKIEADYYVLLNSDVEVSEGWVEPIISFMERNRDVAACQPKILSYHSRDHFEYAGAAGGYLDVLGYPYCRGRVFDTIEKDHGQYDEPAQVFWASGACMFVRANVFHQLGGFNESFFAHMEEIDLCWRIHLTGHTIYCIPQSNVYHVGGGTLSKSNPNKTYLNFRNNLAMLYINSKWSVLFWKLPLKLVLDWLAGFKFWNDNSFEHFKAVLRAHKDCIAQLSQHNRSRQQVRQMATKKAAKPPLQNFLPYQYFMLGKKKFSDL